MAEKKLNTVDKIIVETVKGNILFEKEIQEDQECFLARIWTYILSLDYGLSQSQATGFSYSVRNKLLYNVSYPKDVENILKTITSKYDSFNLA